jgi:formylglycine-generating enzyme required for sulfatase activity
MQVLKNWVLIGLVELSFSAAVFAEPGGEKKDHGKFEVFSPEVVSEVLGKLPSVFDQFKMTAVFPELFMKAKAAHQFSLGEDLSLAQALIQLDRQFVTIPEGFLPSKHRQHPENLIPVPSFEADSYPVTEGLWKAVLGSLPDPTTGFQSRGPNYPITHVAWEERDGSRAEIQYFLDVLNWAAEKVGQRCTYDLPTDSQLHYMIRADREGTNQDRFSAGVTDTNVKEYVTYFGNSNRQIKPVGGKFLNKFGIELGNVWKMSKDIYIPTRPDWGRSIRGGSWSSFAHHAESGNRSSANVGYRFGRMGFSLVRTCH